MKYLPDKHNFEIKRVFFLSGSPFVALTVNYPDCTTFNGKKVIVLNLPGDNCWRINFFKNIKDLDPHFLEDGKVFARFLPTESGWETAKLFVKYGGSWVL